MARFKQAEEQYSEPWAIVPARSWHLLPIVLISVAAVIFVALFVLVMQNASEPILFDGLIHKFMVDIRSEKLTEYMTQITDLAMPLTLLVCCVVLTVFRKGPRVAFVAVLDVIGVELINVLLKHLISRERPDEAFRLIRETSSSFPSGHSVCAMAFYGFLIWLVWHYQRDEIWRNIQIAILVLVIAGIGVSRLYMGVHYCSDVLAGYSAGLIWLVLFTRYIAPYLLDASLRKSKNK